jgi:D-alanine-D-alanine ligase
VKPRIVVLFNKPGPAAEISDAGVLYEARDVDEALREAGYEVEQVGVCRENLWEIVTGLGKEADKIVVFNLCEGLDGVSHHEFVVAGLLDLFGVSYTGNPALTLGWCLDKGTAKAIVTAAGVPTAAGTILRHVPNGRESSGLTFPLVLKPLREDGSLGITSKSYVVNAAALRARTKEMLEEFKQPVLAEAYLPGREFNVSVIGEGESCKVLPPAEMVFEGYAPGEPQLVTHDAKWHPDSKDDLRTRPICPAELDEPLRARLFELAAKAYAALRCRDYARVDFRLDANGEPNAMDVNPNPDICRVVGLARAVNAAGMTYEQFVSGIVEAAWKRRS